jgi:hypothetical protein
MLWYADKLKSAILNSFAVKNEGLISQESNIDILIWRDVDAHSIFLSQM